MPRIPLPTPESLDLEQKKVYDKVVTGPRGRIQGPLRAAIYNAELADKWQALGALLRYKTSLTPRHSELAILITGRACQSPFEWFAHKSEAIKAGIEPDVIEALLNQTQPLNLPAEDLLIWQFCVELNQHNSVSDASYQAALACFGAKTIVELTALVGYYTMVAMTLNCHEIPFPEGVSGEFPWPQQLINQ